MRGGVIGRSRSARGIRGGGETAFDKTRVDVETWRMTPLQRARLATSAVFLANGACIGAWSASIAPLKAALALSDGTLSLILLSFAAGAVLFMPIGGAIAPRLGPTGIVTARVGLAFPASLFLPLLAGNVQALAAAAFVMGATNGVMDVSMNAHAADVEKHWASPIMSSFHAAFSIGGLAGAALGAGLLALGASPGWMLAAVGALALIVTVLSGAALGQGDRPKGAEAPIGWPERGFIGLALIAFLCFMVEGAIVDWSGVYAVSSGVPLANAPAGFAAFSATMVLGRLYGDRVVARLGRLRIVAAGAGLAAFGLALIVAWPNFISLVIGFAIIGAGISNVVPALFSHGAARATTPARGIAAMATAGYTGLLMGPPFVGAIAAASNLRGGMAALALTALIAAGLALAAR